VTETPDDLANRYGPKGEFDKLADALDRMGYSGLSPKDGESWFHLRGIAEWRQGHPSALDWFEKGLDRYPASGLLAFSLGQEWEGRANWSAAEDLFRRVHLGASPEQQRLGLAHVPAQYVMTIVRYCYLWGSFDEGQRQLQTLMNVYGQLGIADDTFLHIRGLPFASEVLRTRCALAILARTPNVASETIAWAKAKLSDIDLTVDEQCLRGWLEDDWGPLTAGLRARIDERGPFSDAFRGYARTNLATVETRSSTTLKEGRASLDRVDLSPQDFAWLGDMKTLAMFGLASRFGDEPLRLTSQVAFLARQALLFEPHHVYAFGLLDVQEPLRDAYRRSKGQPHVTLRDAD
jgi:hypothetical protein